MKSSPYRSSRLSRTLDPALRALSELELGHECAPFLPKQRGWIPSFSANAPDCDRHYEVIHPGRSGLSQAELRKLFEDDLSEDDRSYDNGPETDPFEVARLFTFAAGIQPRDEGATYQVLARDEEGNIVGFLELMVFLEPGNDRIAQLPLPHNAVPALNLHISLERIHILQEFRGQGAARALLTYAGHVYRTEVEHLARAWAPTRDDTEHVLDIVPQVCTADQGELAEAMHRELLSIIDDESELLDEECFDTPELDAVNVHPAQDRGFWDNSGD